MKKRIKKLLLLGVLTTGTIHLLNQFANYNAELKNLLNKERGNYFDWKNGSIYYTVHGKEGSPLLLIHDLNPAASGYEWSRMIRKYEKDHIVYVIDLLGCGRSDKPNFIYTSYLYVEMLHAFISEVIQKKTDVIASGTSAAFTIMTSSLHKEDLGKIIIVNPESLSEYEKIPDQNSRFIKSLLAFPVFGSFVYNIEMSEKNLTRLFKEVYFSNPALVNEKITGTYCESAHKENGSGRFLLASLRGHYMNTNLKPVLKNCTDLYFIGSRDRKKSVSIIDEYTNYNKGIESAFVSGSKYLPQLEAPDKLYEITKLFL